MFFFARTGYSGFLKRVHRLTLSAILLIFLVELFIHFSRSNQKQSGSRRFNSVHQKGKKVQKANETRGLSSNVTGDCSSRLFIWILEMGENVTRVSSPS